MSIATRLIDCRLFEDKYRVYLHTRPAPGLTYYDGHVDVFADSKSQAIDRAIRELIRGSFRGYSKNMFKVDQVELLDG